MHRLKAVLTPAAPATRRARIGAAVATCALLAVVAGGTVAVAAQREPETRVAEALLQATRLMINGETIALDLSALPPFGLQADSVTRSAEQPGWIDFHVRLDPDAPPLSIEGVRLPAGVTTDIVSASDVARIDRTDAGLNIVLKRDDVRPSPPPARDVVAWMPVDFDGNAAFQRGDQMKVTLTDGAGTVLAEALATGPGGFPQNVTIPLTRAEFPGFGQANRAYTLNAEILRADGSVQQADQPTTVRLSPGSQGTARNLTATLSFGE